MYISTQAQEIRKIPIQEALDMAVQNSKQLQLDSLKKQSLSIVLEDLILVEMAFGNKDIDSILQKCEESDILNKALKPHIMGVDLLDLGFTPSGDFKNILNFAMDLQIEENLSKDELRGRIMKSFINPNPDIKIEPIKVT